MMSLRNSKRLAGLLSVLVLGGILFLGGCEGVEDIDDMEEEPEPEAVVSVE